MLFDSHAHLDDKRFHDDRDEVVARAVAGGLTGILNAGADMFSSARAVELAAKHDIVWAAVGIHPHDAKDAREEDYDRLAAWCALPKVVAVGEIGLDYHYDFSPREAQRAVFVSQLDLARQVGKPIIIHDREAHADVLATVKNEGKGLAGVFHCFSGSVEMAREVLKMGFYVSVAGPVTFANAHKLHEVVKAVPLDRLLVETDCPYLTPEPFRGRRNEPAHVRYVAEKVAGLLGLEPEALAARTTENTKRLFGITV
ncbi:TatD family hydrolase [Anaeroselena agilis]|uniref:TatD family hydrolase n=1 Tax=Anaeroselena agilis TaxID=3063788 RepID=A0ABU3P3U3_9FIRM|nr:TatD family hydrolase [Selenomonadales bacterium 4137-cl]